MRQQSAFPKGKNVTLCIVLLSFSKWRFRRLTSKRLAGGKRRTQIVSQTRSECNVTISLCLYYKHKKHNLIDIGFTMKMALQNKNLLYAEFGNRLAAARKRRRLSQAALGTLTGFSRTSITNIERGRQAVQLHHVYTFASVLGVVIDEL